MPRVHVQPDDVGVVQREGQRVTLVARAPPLLRSNQDRHRQESVQEDWPAGVQASHYTEFGRHEVGGESPRMLQTERID